MKGKGAAQGCVASAVFAGMLLLPSAPLAAAAGCPNEAIRAEQGAEVLALPGCMGLEQVSPPQKFNAAAREPQIAAGGERLRFKATAALAGAPSLADPGGDVYLATLGAGGWEVAPTRAPAQFPSGWGVFAAARVFTPDFERWFHVASTPAQYGSAVARAYRAGPGGLFEAFSPLLAPPASQVVAGGVAAREYVAGARPAGASADHARLYLQPGGVANAAEVSYLPGDPQPQGSGEDRNTYVLRLDGEGEPAPPALAARDAEGRAWGGRCGARLGGIGNARTAESDRNQGAISADGARALISTRPGQPEGANCDAAANKLRILERIEGAQGVSIVPLFDSQCNRVAPPCKGAAEADGDDRFQGASVDQSKVYFTTNRQLASTDLDGSNAECDNDAPAVAGCDLYLYDAEAEPGRELVQVSAGHTGGGHEAGKDARVYDGTVAISGDGSHAYFVAEGVLTTAPNPEGDSAEEAPASAPKLYLYERSADHPEGRIAFVGALDPGDGGNGSFLPGLWGAGGTWRNSAYPVPATGKGPGGEETGGDGHVLIFLSKAPLTASDADGLRRDVFRYDASGEELACVSCRGPGADAEPFEVASRRVQFPPGTDFAEERRWASEDGGSVVFKTAEGLVPGDENGVLDSYLWREGAFHRLPGTAAPSDDQGQLRDVPTISHDGSLVAFTSAQRLLPSDIDTAVDTYVARAGGGFPEALEPVSCDPSLAGACRPAPSAPPTAVSPASEGFAGTGNVAAGPSCGDATRRARVLAARAKRLRRAAKRASADRAEEMQRAARRSAREARRLSRAAKRCRADLRRNG